MLELFTGGSGRASLNLDVVRPARTQEVEMPNIMVDGPPLDVDKKRVMAKEMTDSAAKAYGLPAAAFVVVIKENPPENVSVGGCLLCDGRADATD
jgi:4-oxalocrotonate tautomerase